MTDSFSLLGTEILTICDVEELTGISQSYLYILAKKEKIPAKKVGGQWRFWKPAVEVWADEVEDYQSDSIDQYLQKKYTNGSLMNAKNAAIYLRVQPETFYSIIQRSPAEAIPLKKIGRKILFSKKSLQKWLCGNWVETKDRSLKNTESGGETL